jgi:hypothetical protein
MLKQDSSRINDLSAFSYKARLKGCQDISVLYAYDIEKKGTDLFAGIPREQRRRGLLPFLHTGQQDHQGHSCQ